MKQNKHTSHTPAVRLRHIPVSAPAMACLLLLFLLAACTKDDALTDGGDDPGRTPVLFTAAIQSSATPAPSGTKGTTSVIPGSNTVIPGLTRDLPNCTTGLFPQKIAGQARNDRESARNDNGGAAPGTRTAPGGTDGTQTVWKKDDHIGVFMLPAGGKIPADTLPGAHNVPYEVVNPATGELKQFPPDVYDPVTNSWKPGVLTPMYYPSTDEAVDFVAYYPYYQKLTEETPDGIYTPYTRIAGTPDQTTAEKQYRADFLYSDNARGIRRSKDAVTLQFRHLMAKLRLDITLAEGFERGEVTKVTLPGMPWLVYFDMRDGSVNKVWPTSQDQFISCLPLPSPTAGTGADATFTALVPPHSGADFAGRQVTVTVDGMDYTGTIPDADAYTGNRMYAYPVTVTHHGVTISAPNENVPWTDAATMPAGYDLTIADETQLRRFAELVNTGGELPNGTPAAEAKVLQTADITLTVTQEWTPIGNSLRNSFRGAYNGDGHTITGLTITTAPGVGGGTDVGLFGRTKGAVLTGIHLREVRINIRTGNGTIYAGSIAGELFKSTLSLCSADGTVNVDGDAHVYAGGIAGNTLYSTISRCRASVGTTATTTRTDGSARAGEIAGKNAPYSFILSCEAGGMPVTAGGGQKTHAGGIAGENASGIIAFCRTGANTVAAQGASDYNYAGGLVGYGTGGLYSCYSRATATATGGTDNRAGAITGHYYGQVKHCYATGATGPGNSNLAADPANGICYETSPGNGDIFDAVTAYTDVVESFTGGGETVYPTATRHTPATAPAHGILPVRVKWTRAAWQHGINTTYPEIDMTYGGEDNPVAP